MRYGEELQRAAALGADCIHIDVMDGMFVPRISFGYDLVESLKGGSALPFDVHLMIEKPERYVYPYCKAGANLLSFHVEATCHAHYVMQLIHAEGVKCGVAINPATPVSSLAELVEDVDMVLCMAVNPGVPRQSFLPSVLGKVSELDEIRKRNKLHFAIEVDGGINLENLSDVRESGCDIAVVGRAFFKGGGADAIVRSAHGRSLRPDQQL